MDIGFVQQPEVKVWVYNKHGEMLEAVPLKSLTRGAQFLRKPDATKVFYKEHYNRKSWAYPTPSYTCMPNDDMLGSGICINAEATVYVDVSLNNWNDIVKAANHKYSKKA